MTREEAAQIIENMPISHECREFFGLALEALRQPEIVRCKDCKHWDIGHTEECENSDSVCFHNGWCKPDWFCADGEPKDSD